MGGRQFELSVPLLARKGRLAHLAEHPGVLEPVKLAHLRKWFWERATTSETAPDRVARYAGQRVVH